MTNNDTNTAPRPLTHAERLALYSNATPTITMPDRPTDRSRNGMRAPRSVRHRSIR